MTRLYLCFVVLSVGGLSAYKAGAQTDGGCNDSQLSKVQKINCESKRSNPKEQGSSNASGSAAKNTETYSELLLRQKLSSMAQVALPDDI